MRAIRTPAPPDPDWLGAFLAELARADVAPATSRGYAYDLRHFLAWHASQPGGFSLERLGSHDLIAYRQHLLAVGCRSSTINRRLAALRRLSRWAHAAGTLRDDAARDLRPVRTARNRQPAGLTDTEVARSNELGSWYA